METATSQKDFRRLDIIYKTLFSFCALCCFIAVLQLPLFYYTFLRIVVFITAGIVVYHFWRQREFRWVVIFGLILILFNPIVPIHLYLKSLWIPIDIVTGILFLLLVVIRLNKKELPQESIPGKQTPAKTFSRDRIIKTSSKNNYNNE